MIYLVIMIVVAAAGIFRLWLMQRRERTTLESVDSFWAGLERIGANVQPGGDAPDRSRGRRSRSSLDPARRSAAKKRIAARRAAVKRPTPQRQPAARKAGGRQPKPSSSTRRRPRVAAQGRTRAGAERRAAAARSRVESPRVRAEQPPRRATTPEPAPRREVFNYSTLERRGVPGHVLVREPVRYVDLREDKLRQTAAR